MSRKYGDPENSQKKTDRFDQMPRWLWKSRKFISLSGPEAKLLIYLIGRVDWQSHIVPAVSPSELAEAVGFNRNCMSEAVKNLAFAGIIALKKQKRKLYIQVLYIDPDIAQQSPATDAQQLLPREQSISMSSIQQRRTTSPLSAEVMKLSAPPELGNKMWPRRHGSVAESARNDGRILTTAEAEPAWVTDIDPCIDEMPDSEDFQTSR